MNHRAALSDLVATAPAVLSQQLDRASNAFDSNDLESAVDWLSEVARMGHTSWHQRAEALAEAIGLQADLDGLAMHVEGQDELDGTARL